MMNDDKTSDWPAALLILLAISVCGFLGALTAGIALILIFGLV